MRSHFFYKKSPGFILWVVFFCFSICAALIFQKILVPIISPETSGTGLLPDDATHFHGVASKLAEEIREYGWGVWQIFPSGGAGNVAVAAAVYAIFGNDPTNILPINAALHALGGLLIFHIVRLLANDNIVGTYAGIIAGALFVVFPSALSWYGQLHKDSYAIAGILLILLSFIRIHDSKSHSKIDLLIYCTLVVIGVALLGMVRPYSLKMLLVAILVILVLDIFVYIYKKSLRQNCIQIVFLLTTLVLVAIVSKNLAQLENAQSGDTYVNWAPAIQASDSVWTAWQWHDSKWLPMKLDKQMETLAKTRAGLIDFGVKEKAGSMIDIHKAPQSASEILAYSPRAFQIAAFAPFPNKWFESLSPIKLVVAMEMVIYYIALPGILILLIFNRRPVILLTLLFVSIFLVINGLVIANVGTLYRLRYAYMSVLMALGVLGWVTFFYRSGKVDRVLNRFKKKAEISPLISSSENVKNLTARNQTISASIVVMLLTLVCFLGFFARDIMMVHTYGFGGELDYFYIALMIPMFLVTTLSMPLGSVFVPFYLDQKEKSSDAELMKTVKGISALLTWILLIVSIIIFMTFPWVSENYYADVDAEGQLLLHRLVSIALPLLLFSGAMIIGNSLLNANGKTIFTSVAQLVVPVLTIAALLLFGEKYGVISVLYGMVLGQILNLMIVQLRLRAYKTSIVPSLRVIEPASLAPLFKQFWPLVGSAIFVGMATPVATLLTMSLNEGAVSVFNLGSKVVLFVTGLVGAVVTTVLLPYFSSMIAKSHLVDARRELSFFLLSATFVTVPLSIGIYLFSDHIVDLMLAGGNFGPHINEQVTRVMEYSIVQLPFFVCNALLLRFAIATKHVLSIFVIAVLGLIANVVISILLIKHMGVAGVALGGSIAMLLSTILLALVLVRHWHITLFDLIVILLNWMLFITLLIGIHFNNLASVYVVGIAYTVLMIGYLKTSIKLSSSRVGTL